MSPRPKSPSPSVKKPARAPKRSPARTPAAAESGRPRPAGKAVSPLSLDEASGAAALDRLRPRLAALSPKEVVPLHFGVRLAATAALGLSELVTERDLDKEFSVLEKAGLLDPAHRDGLPDLARALWYVRHRLDQHTALSSQAALPAELVEEATALRRDMLRVLDFRLAEQPAVLAQLDVIRRGSGYQDLVDDLIQLAGLYTTHRVALRDTPAPYRSADSQKAGQLATQILTTLGLAPALRKTRGGAAAGAAAEDWGGLQLRIGALLERSYDELSAAGRFLCRHQPERLARFASLASIARARRTRGPAAPEDPSPPAPPSGP